MLDKKAIGRRIERLRKDKTGMSQYVFAEKLGICRTTYVNVIKGNGLFNHLEDIAGLLGVSEIYLLLGYDPVDGNQTLRLEQDCEARLKQQRDYYEGLLELARKDIDKYRSLYEDQKDSNRLLSQLSRRRK